MMAKSGVFRDYLAFCGYKVKQVEIITVFRGVQHINMDAKGRLAMPSRQREPLLEQCAGKIVVTIDTKSSCLVIYPLPEWERIEQEIQRLPALKPAVKRFQRLMLGYATDLELDGSGRMVLPAPLREYAKLSKKLVLLGQGNKLELWAEELWDAERDQALQDSAHEEDLPEELMSLTL
ncbi:MAG: MraZ protein [Halioglobus sp.]|jgi:MraZ protein